MMGLLTAGLATPVALATVALIGYVVGHRRSRQPQPLPDLEAINRTFNQKLQSANDLIIKVESISDQLRRSMAAHHCAVSRAREEFQVLTERHSHDADPAHHMHLQEMMLPTQRLSDDIAQAYDELRQQSQALELLRTH